RGRVRRAQRRGGGPHAPSSIHPALHARLRGPRALLCAAPRIWIRDRDDSRWDGGRPIHDRGGLTSRTGGDELLRRRELGLIRVVRGRAEERTGEVGREER